MSYDPWELNGALKVTHAKTYKENPGWCLIYRGADATSRSGEEEDLDLECPRNEVCSLGKGREREWRQVWVQLAQAEASGI